TKNEEIYIGETAVNSKNIQFVVTSVSNTKKISTKTTNYNYVVITIKISNKGKESWDPNPNYFTLLLNDNEYDYNSATYYLDDGMTSTNEVNPNISKTYRIAFETPTQTTEDIYKLKIKYSIISSDYVTVILKKRT
ncbi:MAG: DUF4352 domain-containing protein, partial [Clostridia bacterium]|nr:DUF4352 domain-containing protein [Clostridia bacterium]